MMVYCLYQKRECSIQLQSLVVERSYTREVGSSRECCVGWSWCCPSRQSISSLLPYLRESRELAPWIILTFDFAFSFFILIYFCDFAHKRRPSLHTLQVTSVWYHTICRSRVSTERIIYFTWAVGIRAKKAQDR